MLLVDWLAVKISDLRDWADLCLKPARSDSDRFYGALAFWTNFETGDYNNDLVALRTAKSNEGSRSQEQREWRVNLVTSYGFREGRFKGLSVVVAYRWRMQLNVRNGFADDSFIPIQLPGQVVGGNPEDATIARVRAPSPTEYILTSTFSF